jgi:hypothetical protein
MNRKLTGFKFVMSKKLRILASLLVGSTIGLSAGVASAQDVNGELFRPQETPQEAMEREFFDHDKSTLKSRDLGGIVDPAHLIGLPGYNDNMVLLDAKSINRMHRYLQEQQTYSNPTLRVPDLVSPFNTSVQLLPTQAGLSPVSNGGGMPGFERPTVPESVAQPPMPAPIPVAAPTPRQPVEAKF